ncbi:hypothetical protein N2152v2_009706 [Parachlorella kessleri]
MVRLAFFLAEQRLHAVLTSWGGSRCLRVPQQTALSQGWHGQRRGFRPSLAAASAGGSPEQPLMRGARGRAPQPPAQQPAPDAWEQACQQWRQKVEAFYQQHGRLPRATAGKPNPFLPGEKELGRWVDRQRQCYKGNKQPPLSAERIAALDATPGWMWEDYSPWKLRYQQVQDFVQQHDRLPREQAGKSNPMLPGEKELGSWCHTQRQRFKGNSEPPLTAEQQAALAALPGWYWYLDARWEQQRLELEAFQQQHGRPPRVRAGKSHPLLPGEKERGNWCYEQRKRWKGQSLSPPQSAEQQAALAALPGWYWDVEDVDGERWEQRRQEVVSFYQQHGRLPRKSAGKASPFLPGEKELGQWVNRQRQRYKGNIQPALSAEHVTALEVTPGWAWDDRSPWEQQRQKLEAFVWVHGRLPRDRPIKKGPLLEGEQELARWRRHQRRREQGSGGLAPLSAEQQAALKATPLWRREG